MARVETAGQAGLFGLREGVLSRRGSPNIWPKCSTWWASCSFCSRSSSALARCSEFSRCELR